MLDSGSPASRALAWRPLAAVLERLACFEAPARAWEANLLPARLSDVDPAWLERFCLSGQKAWRRRRPDAPREGAAATLQNRVEIPILYLMSSEDPDPYTRTRSAY